MFVFVNILVVVVTVVSFILLGIAFSKKKPALKKMIVIAIFSAIAFVLSMIEFISYPQGGGINLLPMLPVMFIGIFYGGVEGVTCGLIYGMLHLLKASSIIAPAQALLDYILPSMVLGLSGFLGRDLRKKYISGAFIVGCLSVFCNILSGVYFYGEYAPKGMNVLIYSIIYNASTLGVVALLSVIALAFVPMDRLKKAVKA